MKYSPKLISALQHRLQTPLPGLDAQMRLAPSIRGRTVRVPPDARQSAVLILLYPHENQWHIPFMRRSQDGLVH
ncbi:MAG: coenzyme A pyrophosphatase, partial [Bacteroidota bacterium]